MPGAMLILAALLVAAPPEDAAHRADRLRTIELNRRAAAAARPRVPRSAQSRYRAERARYEAELADWRRQVAECRGGDEDACD